MSIFLRAVPTIAVRAKPFYLTPLLLLGLNFHNVTKPSALLKRSTSSVSASATLSFTEAPIPNAKQPVIAFKDALEWVSRTALCGELSEDHVGKRVRLCGWVARHRIHGGLTFLNLRDHSGIVQVTTLPEEFPDTHSIVNDLRLEYVIAVEGVVQSRPSESINKKMKTGMIDVAAEHVQVLNTVRSKLLFLVTTTDDTKDSVKEEILLRLRLQYSLDLLRKVPGIIWCPQGFRCYRDEDLRADRQPEFTQLDMELAFTPLEDMLRINEDLIRQVFLEIKGVQLPNPFPRLTYAEAMSKYGSGRPDVRFDLELKDVSDIFMELPFKFLEIPWQVGELSKHYVPLGAKFYSNTALKKRAIYNEAIKSGAKGLPFLKVMDDGAIEGIPALVSSLHPTKKDQLLEQCSAGSGDLILFAIGHHASVNKTLDWLRVSVVHELGLVDHSRHSIFWVTDFLMFEWNSSEQRLEALHHPFTAPNPEDTEDLSTVHALAYDMVYNGVEIGGGSLRIFKREVQEKVLEIVGISSEEAEEKFGYLLEALDMGAPPHGMESVNAFF